MNVSEQPTLVGTHKKAERSGVIAVIALVVALLALLIGWLAYNKVGDTVTDDISTAYQQFEQDVSLTAARIEARSELLALRAELRAERTIDNAQTRLEQIRMNLEAAYAEAELEAVMFVTELDADFEVLETQIRDNSADAIDSIDDLLEKIEQDIRTDEQ